MCIYIYFRCLNLVILESILFFIIGHAERRNYNLGKKHLSTNLQSLLDECLFSQIMPDCSSIISAAVLIEVWHETKMYLLIGVLVLHRLAVWGILRALLCAHNGDGGGILWMDGRTCVCAEQLSELTAAGWVVAVSPVLYISHSRGAFWLRRARTSTLRAHCHSSVVQCLRFIEFQALIFWMGEGAKYTV